MIESLIGLVYLIFVGVIPASNPPLGRRWPMQPWEFTFLGVCRGQTHWSQILHLHVLLLPLEETGLQFLIESFDWDSLSNLHCFNSCIHSSTSETNGLCNLGNHLNSNMYSIDKNLLRHVGVTWQGKVPIISLEGLHQLHIFIFVMTVVHVVYCCATVFLGFYKVWGLSTQSICFLYWYSAARVAISLWWEWLQFFRRCMDGKSGKKKHGR